MLLNEIHTPNRIAIAKLVSDNTPLLSSPIDSINENPATNCPTTDINKFCMVVLSFASNNEVKNVIQIAVNSDTTTINLLSFW